MVAHRLRGRLAMEGSDYHLVVLGEEPCPAYDRVHLTDCLMGRASSELESPAPDVGESSFELHLGDPVLSIDRAARQVHTVSGRSFTYDRLVLATGSRAARPRITGLDGPNVFTYRNLGDLEPIRACAKRSRSAVVLGGGLLGLEAARALEELCGEVHVVELSSHLLPLQLDSAGAALLKRHVEARGLQVHFERRTLRIQHLPDAKIRLEFQGGESLVTDMLLVAVGIVPNDELARDAGLSCAARGGIDVDASMHTSDPLISAVGECASVDGQTHGLVAPCFEMVDVLVRDLAGRPARFRVPQHATRLKLAMADVATIGDALGTDKDLRVLRWQSGDKYRKLVLRGRELVGAAAVGHWPELERVQEAIRAGRVLWPWGVLRFRSRGMIWSPENQLRVQDLPEKATICSCFGVTRGELSLAVESGARDVATLMRVTGAGSVCGSCEPALCQLVDPQRQLSVPAVALGLLGLSLIAIFASLGFAWVAFSNGLGQAASSSWREPGSMEFLWRSSGWQQVSGYLILFLLAVSLTLVVRKRWRIRLIGGPSKWRALHAVAALTSLGILCVHTGMAPGRSLLAVFSAFTLAAYGSGGMLGVLFALPGLRTGSAAWHLKRILWWVHIALLWALPVLCFFHVLAVYRF